MGSSAFAEASLTELLKDGSIQIVDVYTKLPKPAGRGMQARKTPVHKIAQMHGLSTSTPSSLKTVQLPECDVIAVVAYGLILPQAVIDHPKIAAINVHPSLLPRWRGAAPMQQAFLNCDKKTGVSIVQMTQELDAGDIYMQKETIISDHESYQDLHNRLATMGGQMLVDVICNIKKIKAIPQQKEGILYARKPPNSMQLDCAKSINNILKEMDVFCGVETKLGKTNLKILKSDYLLQRVDKDEVGHIKIDKKQLKIFCSDGILIPTIVQKQGKKAVNVADFLNGFRE